MKIKQLFLATILLAGSFLANAQIGSGDRSEKIRTYNYPQNRITDHRIGFTITQLDRVMEGKLDDVIAALQADDEKKKLEAAGE